MSNQNNNIFLLKSLSNLSKKSSPDKIKFNLFSIYASIIQSRNLFPKNMDIKNLTDLLPLSKPIREYLFSARPQLLARLITEINKASDEDIYIYLEIAKKYVHDEGHNEINKRKKVVKTNYIDDLLVKYSRGSDDEL